MKSRNNSLGIPQWQQTIQDECFHPTGKFVPFEKGEIEQSIPKRFEKMATMYSDRVAVKSKESVPPLFRNSIAIRASAR